jgi:hypothetical protein
VSEALVDHGHLVYRPHEAFKGAWDEDVVLKDRYRSPQAVNDAAIRISDVVINLTPDWPGVVSQGTDDEMAYCRSIGKRVVWAPPGVVNAELVPLALENPAVEKLVAEAVNA